MKRTTAMVLAFCMCICLCACEQGGTPAEQSTTMPEGANSMLSQGQIEAVESTARLHAVIDYNYTFVSITHETIYDDGTYITITGVVTMEESNGTQYHGDYSVTLAKGAEEDTYTTKSWELGTLLDEKGNKIDYYAKLYDYVVRVGEYDSTDKVSYVYKKGAANVDLMLLAQNNKLSYWYFTSYETYSTSFMLSYKCTLNKDAQNSFEFQYSYIDGYYNGIAISGETANVKGKIDNLGDNVTVSTEKYVSCDKKTILPEIKSCHKDGVDFIEEVLKDAGIGCTFEQLLG